MTGADGERTAAQYDAMARPYAEFNEINVANAHYERPATMALLGELTGKRVLEVGCGAGTLTEWMVGQGAFVTGFDVSGEMLALARQKVGERATLLQADLHDPLSFAEDGSFDVIVASLVFHYLRDWERVLTELKRVLVPDGYLVFSTHHPAWDWQNHSAEDYFAIKQVSETWMRGGEPFEVTFWRRPLRAMTEAISSVGFFIDELIEPDPLPEIAEFDPEAYLAVKTQPFFIFFRLRPRT